MSTAKEGDNSNGLYASAISAVSVGQAEATGEGTVDNGRKENSGSNVVSDTSSGNSSSGSNNKEFKRALSFQYKIFASQFDYLHGVLLKLSGKYNGLDILSTTEPSTMQDESAGDCNSTLGVSDVKNRFMNEIEEWERKANMSKKERAVFEAAQKEEQKQKEKAKVKTNRRLPQVTSDVFELKLLQLLDRFGTLSNAEAAKHAVVLFKNQASSYEHRSLAMSVIYISIPQQQTGDTQSLNSEKKSNSVISRPLTSSYIFHAFFVEASGCELLARWLVAAIVDENFDLGKFITDTLKGAIDGFKRLNIKTSALLQQTQLTKVKALTQEALQKEQIIIGKMKSEREKEKESEASTSGSLNPKTSSTTTWGPTVVTPTNTPSKLLSYQEDVHNSLLKSLQMLARSVDASLKAHPSTALTTESAYAPNSSVSAAESLKAKKRLLDKKEETSIKKKAKGPSTLAAMLSSNDEEKSRIKEEKERKKQMLQLEREREREERMGKKSNKAREKQQGKQRAAGAPHDTKKLNLVALNRKSTENVPVFVPFGKAGSNGECFKSSSSKRIKWRDQDENNPDGALSEIREYDMVLEELQAMGTFKPRKHGYLLQDESIGIGEDDIDNSNEELSYSDRRRLEHRLEKEDLSRSQHEAKTALRSLASKMALQIPWMTPDALALNANQMVEADSRENKQQTTRLSKKAATTYLRDQDIPMDPFTAQSTKDGNLGVNIGGPSSATEIPWYDEEELAALQESQSNERYMSPAISTGGGVGGIPEELMSLLPEYVFNLEEEQLSALVQLLGDEQHMYLLEDPSSEEFRDFVSRIAPGSVIPRAEEAGGGNSDNTNYYAQEQDQYYQQQSSYAPPPSQPPSQSSQQSFYGHHQPHQQQYPYYDQHYYSQPTISSYAHDPHHPAYHQQQQQQQQQQHNYNQQQGYPPHGQQYHHQQIYGQQQQGYGGGYGSYGGGYSY